MLSLLELSYKQLATWASGQMEDVEVNLLGLNDFESPVYGIDKEQDSGIPEEAKAFKNLVQTADGILISFAEHNGSYSAAFKNILDWISRIEQGTWSNRPMLLLSTSPGPRGGASVLGTAKMAFPYQGGQVAGSFSLPSFGQNFNATDGITDPELLIAFNGQLDLFKQAI